MFVKYAIKMILRNFSFQNANITFIVKGKKYIYIFIAVLRL